MSISVYDISVSGKDMALFLVDHASILLFFIFVGGFVFFGAIRWSRLQKLVFLLACYGMLFLGFFFRIDLATKSAVTTLEKTIVQALVALEQPQREKFAQRIVESNTVNRSLPVLIQLERDVLTELRDSLLAKKRQGLPKQKLLEEIRLSSSSPVQPAIKNLINDLYTTADSPLSLFARRILDNNTTPFSQAPGKLNVDNGARFAKDLIIVRFSPYIACFVGVLGVVFFLLLYLRRPHQRRRTGAPGHESTEKKHCSMKRETLQRNRKVTVSQ